MDSKFSTSFLNKNEARGAGATVNTVTAVTTSTIRNSAKTNGKKISNSASNSANIKDIKNVDGTNYYSGITSITHATAIEYGGNGAINTANPKEYKLVASNVIPLNGRLNNGDANINISQNKTEIVTKPHDTKAKTRNVAESKLKSAENRNMNGGEDGDNKDNKEAKNKNKKKIENESDKNKNENINLKLNKYEDGGNGEDGGKNIGEYDAKNGNGKENKNNENKSEKVVENINGDINENGGEKAKKEKKWWWQKKGKDSDKNGIKKQNARDRGSGYGAGDNGGNDHGWHAAENRNNRENNSISAVNGDSATSVDNNKSKDSGNSSGKPKAANGDTDENKIKNKIKKEKIPVIIEADSIKSNHLNSKILAEGNVLLIRGKYRVTADKITYDKENQKIYLEDRAKFTDSENNNIFANRAELADDVKTGDFSDAGIIMNSGLSIVSPHIVKEDDDNYTGSDAEYFFCPNEDLNMDLSYDEIVREIKGANGNLQLFTVHSKNSRLDRRENKIYLNSVTIKLMGVVPILWLPYFSTTRPTLGKTSGIEVPSVFKHRNYGFGISLPMSYYNGPFEMQLEPYVYQGGNFYINSAFSYGYGNNFYIHVEPRYIFDNGKSAGLKNRRKISEEKEGVYRNNRLDLRLSSRAIFGDSKIFFKTSINYITDPYLRRDYFDDYTKTLQSNLDLFKIDDNQYFGLNMLYFQQILERRGKTINETPTLIPNMYYSYSNHSYGNFSFGLDSNALTSHNIFTNQRYDRFSIYPHVGYRNMFYGLFFQTNLTIHGDVYRQSYNKTIALDKNYRLYPDLELKLFYLFRIPLFHYITVKPILQLFVSDSRQANFIDLDSKKSEITTNNLFSSNRYNGYDLVEKGRRINYGLESKVNTTFGNFKIIIGQSYRDWIDPNYRIIGFDGNLSDILTGISYSYGGYVDINYLNNMRVKTHSIDRQEAYVHGYVWRMSYGVGYVKIQENAALKISSEEQLNFNLNYFITRRIRMHFYINSNILERRVIQYGGGLFYENNCFLAGFNVSKHNYVESYEEENNFSMNFSFRVKNLKF